MKYFLLVISLFCMFGVNVCYASSSTYDDVYLIFYATYDGESGHVGIAIDNYRLRSIPGRNASVITGRYDSIHTGTLTYYDLWPKNPFLDRSYSNKDIAARYCKLPKASWENGIDLYTLYYKGIPQNKGYPCDGMIRIKTSPWQDYRLIEFLDSIVLTNPPFNVRENNCADFIEQAIEYLTGEDLDAEEVILFRSSTTPNRLFEAVAKLEGVKLLKDPGNKVSGTFWQERILDRYIQNNSN